MKITPKDIDMGNYTLKYYKCNRFTSNQINFVFETKLTKNKIYDLDMLADYLMSTNKEYKTLKEIQDKGMDLYSTSLLIDNYRIGNKLITHITISLMDKDLVKDDYYEEAFKYLKTLLFNPNFTNGKYDETIMNRRKEAFKEDLKNRLLSPTNKSYNSLIKHAFKNTYISKDLITTSKEVDKVLDASANRVIKTYDELINKSFVGGYIFGNFEEKYIKKIKEYFKFNYVKPFDRNYSEEISFDNIADKDVYDKDLNESVLTMIYDIKNYSKKEINLYKAIMYFINFDSGRMLHKTLRDKLNIVYSSNASLNLHSGFIVFEAFIDYKNKDKCIKGIESVLEDLKDKRVVKKELAMLRKTLKEKRLLNEELKPFYTHSVSIDYFKNNTSFDEFYEDTLKFKEEDIIKAINKLERKVTYLYAGTKQDSKEDTF